MTELVSGNRLAKLLGVSPTSVRNAEKGGRIKRLPNGLFDPIAARAAWAANTDPTVCRVRSADDAGDQGEEGAGREPEEQQPSPFHLARTDKEAWTAQLRRLEYEQKAGRLVDADEVRAAVFSLARNARDRWLNWPNRIAAVMAQEIEMDPKTGKASANSVAIVLERMVREHCAELGEPETLNLRKPR